MAALLNEEYSENENPLQTCHKVAGVVKEAKFDRRQYRRQVPD
jgi:hypothetical protein